jgi:hypothetical protein
MEMAPPRGALAPDAPLPGPLAPSISGLRLPEEVRGWLASDTAVAKC